MKVITYPKYSPIHITLETCAEYVDLSDVLRDYLKRQREDNRLSQMAINLLTELENKWVVQL